MERAAAVGVVLRWCALLGWGAARAVGGSPNAEGGWARCSRVEIALVTSNGLARGDARSGHSGSGSVFAGEGLGMESDYDFASAVYGRELDDPAEVGRRAGERAVRRLHAKKPPTRDRKSTRLNSSH